MRQVFTRSINAYIALKATIIFLFVVALLLSGCSYQGNGVSKEEAFEDGYKTFVFYDKVDDWDSDNPKINKWKVVFKDDEIYRLYKNDKRVPDSEIDEYEELVYDNIPGTGNNLKVFRSPGGKDSFNFRYYNDGESFDKEKFRKQMEELKKELKKMKKFKFDFDEEAFNNDMDKLKEELEDLSINPPRIHMDMEAFEKSMEEFAKKMEKQQYALQNLNIQIPEINIPPIDVDIPEIPEINIPEINIDMSNLAHNMRHFDESMSDLDESMEKLDREMKKLDAFMDDFSDELVKEGIIKNKDEQVRIEYDKGVLEINGKKASESLTDKYKRLYRKHFNREPDERSAVEY